MTATTDRPPAPPTGKPVLLDAYCGAGGAARGYQLAGFYVVGVDSAPQPRYAGDEFHRGDAIEFIRRHGREFDAIHASPPCQSHTALRRLWGRDYVDLVGATRAALLAAERLYVIENVPGAPLVEPILLCGSMFPALRVYRHRLFECSWFFLAPPHGRHGDRTPRAGGGISPKGFISVVGHHGKTAYAGRAMGIDWMTMREQSQSIPPAYTNWLGVRLLRALGWAA